MKENTAVQVQEQTQPPKKKGFKARFLMLVSALAAMMMVGASAAEGDAASGDFTAVMSSMDTLSTLMTKVWSMMTSNPLLVLFLAVMLLGVGVSVFRMIKRAARR